ncbi:MAG: two-component sensor histidine kinase [Lachnospiraceae bacterium]|nr:two-component sensor histidine kinase [Lachnospiraceae bacterium]
MRFVIFVCFFLLTTMFILLYSYFLQKTYEKRIIDQRKNFTINQSNILLNQLVSAGYFNGDTDRNLENQIEQLATAFDGRIMLVDSDYRILSDTYQLNQNKYLISENVIKSMTGVMTDSENNQIIDDYIASYIPVNISVDQTEEETAIDSTNPLAVNNQTGMETIGLMVVYSSIKSSNNTINYAEEQSKQLLFLFIIVILMVAGILTVVLTGHFRDFSRNIVDMAEGRDVNIVVHGFTEMRELAKTFNDSITKMNKLEESRQEFVSNVSHELKTPITSVKVLADSLINQEDVPVEIYREFMEDIVEEVDRENKIINDLLTLVKLDRKSQDVLNVTTVSINELLELLLKRLRPLAAKRDIEIVYESLRQVNAEIDEVKLTLALSNLIENAIKYNKDEGWIRITLNADHKYFYVKIADSGVGIPEDCKDHVFERFYRVDKARSRDTGGTGLGLAITKNAIVMHHGTIKLHSVPGEGTTFTVRIPLTYSVNLAASNVSKAANVEPEKGLLSLLKKNIEDKKPKAKAKTVILPNVSEVKGNLGEVFDAVDHTINKEPKEPEIEPEEDVSLIAEAEPEVVVLHTEEMYNPQVVVIKPEEVEDKSKASSENVDDEALDESEGESDEDALASEELDASDELAFDDETNEDKEGGNGDE